MTIVSITEIKCDYETCDKTFIVRDDKPPTPGVEQALRVLDAHGDKLSFCGWKHLLMYGADVVKSSKRLENTANLHIVQNSRQATDVALAKESLNLEEE